MPTIMTTSEIRLTEMEDNVDQQQKQPSMLRQDAIKRMRTGDRSHVSEMSQTARDYISKSHSFMNNKCS